MARSIAGLFPDRTSAEQAVEDLKAAGFDPARIGVVMRDKSEQREVAEEHGTRSLEGAVTGSLIGGSIGGILAATGTLVIPGIGPFLSAGILATSIVGGTAGWLVGSLVGLGIPHDEAEYYQNEVHQGRALVTVDPQGRDDEARQILMRDGAEDFESRGSTAGTDTVEPVMGRYDNTSAVNATDMGTTAVASTPEGYSDTTGNDLRVPLREEELVVGTQEREQGRVHLHKEVVQESQTTTVPVAREQVTIERVPMSGDATTTDTVDAFTNRDIEVPVMGEEAVVGKRVHEVEEVRLHKQAVTEQEQVSDTVRKERVYVDGADDVVEGQGTGRQTTY